MNPELSVVIPLYNEEKRIPKTIDKIFTHLKNYPVTAEVLFVNDGSKDGTTEVLNQFGHQYTFRSIGYAENRGKGFAVRYGADRAKGRWVVFFDIDLATPLTSLELLLPFLRGEREEKIVLGNRHLEESEIVKHESLIRVVLGKGFRMLSRLYVPSVTDFTCGFKAFQRDASQQIFSAAKIDRWAFDTEIVYLASRFGYKIAQIPVQWTHDSDSRVRVLHDILSSVKELLQIVWYALSGAYGNSKSRVLISLEKAPSQEGRS